MQCMRMRPSVRRPQQGLRQVQPLYLSQHAQGNHGCRHDLRIILAGNDVRGQGIAAAFVVMIWGGMLLLELWHLPGDSLCTESLI